MTIVRSYVAFSAVRGLFGQVSARAGMEPLTKTKQQPNCVENPLVRLVPYRYCAASILAFLAASPALAQEQAVRTSEIGFFQVHGVPDGYNLNIREQPDTNSPLVGQIPARTRKIHGFGCTDNTSTAKLWCRVKYGDLVGWVSDQFIRRD